MNDSPVLKYEKIDTRPPSDGMSMNTTETLLKTTAEQAADGTLILIYRAVEHIVNRALNRGAEDHTFSSRLVRRTKF